MDAVGFLRAELAVLLATLRGETTTWICEHMHGPAGEVYARHASQLGALGRWFEALLGALGERLATAVDGDELRALRRAGLGVLSLWEPLRARLVQREASDEAVWRCADAVSDSCYAPTLAALRRRCGAERVARRPYPLPFLSPVVSPYMLPAGYLPREFTQSLGPAARGFARGWPLPMVHLPVACKWDPWWMVMLGHEVGHQVEVDLEISGPLAEALASAGRASHWSGWSHEVFADAYAVMVLGRAAIRALYELVQDGSSLCQRHPDYPPAVVRLAVMQRLADELGLVCEGVGLPEEFEPLRLAAGDRACLADLAVVPEIVAVLRDRLPGWPCTLAELCAPHPADVGVLRPRRAIARQFAEYVALRGSSPAELPGRREALRAETLVKIAALAPTGSRGGFEAMPREARGDTNVGVVVAALMAADWSSM